MASSLVWSGCIVCLLSVRLSMSEIAKKMSKDNFQKIGLILTKFLVNV